MAIASYADRELRWAHALKEVKERLGALFGRIEPRRAALSFLDGLLSGIERKTGGQLAERVGDPGPWRMQAVLGRGHWDADAARDLVRTYVIEELGAAAGVLVVDETGFVMKGISMAIKIERARFQPTPIQGIWNATQLILTPCMQNWVCPVIRSICQKKPDWASSLLALGLPRA